MKEGTFRRGVRRGNPSARTQLFAADRRTSHGSKKEETIKLELELYPCLVQRTDGLVTATEVSHAHHNE